MDRHFILALVAASLVLTCIVFVLAFVIVMR